MQIQQIKISDLQHHPKNPRLIMRDDVIDGYSVDCKSSVLSGFPLQVSPHILKQENIDVYAFFQTDKKLSFIEPLGFISRKNYLDKAIVVKQGENIPGTGVKQRFGESYFLEKDNLKKFIEGINIFKTNKKKAA